MGWVKELEIPNNICSAIVAAGLLVFHLLLDLAGRAAGVQR